LGMGSISQVSISPDGKIAAVIRSDGFHWYDAKTMAELGSLMGGDPYLSPEILFSPNSRYAVVEGTVGAFIVDFTSSSEIADAHGGNGFVSGYIFSKDNHYLAYRVGDRSTGGPYHSIRVIDLTTGTTMGQDSQDPEAPFYATLQSDRYHVMSDPAISPDSKLLAAGHSDGRVYVWELSTGKARFTLEGHSDRVTSVAFSPDGSALASSSADGTVRLWNVAIGQPSRVITGFKNKTEGVRYSVDGAHLVVAVQDEPTQVVDLASGKLSDLPVQPTSTPPALSISLHQQGFLDGAMSTQTVFSPDGLQVAVAQGSIAIFDVKTRLLSKTLVPSHAATINGLVYSPNGERLAAASEDGDVWLWDLASGNLLLDLTSETLAAERANYAPGTTTGYAIGGSAVNDRGITFSPDGNRLAFGNGPAIEVWEIASVHKKLTLDQVDPPTLTAHISYSTDGQRIYAILDRNRRAAVWDAGSGELIKEVPLPKVDPNAFSATGLHGPLLARNNYDDTGYWIELWNLDTGTMTRLDTTARLFEPLFFSPDGSLFVSVSAGQLFFWRTDTHQSYIVDNTDLAGDGFSLDSDNRTLAVAWEGKVTLWDVHEVSDLLAHSTATNAPPTTGGGKLSTWPTATPTVLPTGASQPSSQSTSQPGAISAGNATQVHQLSQFGDGTIERLAWSVDGTAVQTAGSTGLYRYAVADANKDLTLSQTLLPNTWVYSFATTSDGRTLAAGISGDHVLVWDSATGAVLTDLEGSGQPALAPDGTSLAYLAPDGSDGTLTIYDLTAQQKHFSLLDENGAPQWPVFSPDGSLVAAIHPQAYMGRYAASVRVWDAVTGAIVSAQGGPDVDIIDLSFSPDGQYLIAAAGGSAWVWDVLPGGRPFKLELYSVKYNGNMNLYDQRVTAAAMSPDNHVLAVGTSENSIQLYNPTTGAFLRKLEGLSNAPHRMAFNPSGSLLLVADDDGVITVWNEASGERLSAFFGHTGPLGGLVFRMDGDLAAWEGGTAWTIHPSTGDLIHTTRIPSGKIYAASPAGDWLAVYSQYQMSLWNAVNGQFRQSLEGKAIEPFLDYFYEGEGGQQFYGATFSADGSRLVTNAAGGVWYFDTQAGKLLQHLAGTLVKKAVLSADGAWLIYGSHELAAAMTSLNLRTGAEASIPDVKGAGTSSDFAHVAISADNRLAGALFSAWNENNQLIIWDLANGDKIGSLVFPDKPSFSSLALSPDHLLAAVGMEDGSIQLVDLQRMQVIATLTGHRGTVQALVFSANGSLLASTDQDGTVRVWGIN
jgi:WD40 repeat protein